MIYLAIIVLNPQHCQLGKGHSREILNKRCLRRNPWTSPRVYFTCVEFYFPIHISYIFSHTYVYRNIHIYIYIFTHICSLYLSLLQGLLWTTTSHKGHQRILLQGQLIAYGYRHPDSCSSLLWGASGAEVRCRTHGPQSAPPCTALSCSLPSFMCLPLSYLLVLDQGIACYDAPPSSCGSPHPALPWQPLPTTFPGHDPWRHKVYLHWE